MSWYDPWDELSYFQEELLGWLDDKLGGINNWLRGIGDSITDKIWDLLDGLVDGLSGVKNAIFEQAGGLLDYVKQLASDIWEDVADFLSDQWNTISDYWADIWEDVKDFLGDQFDLIREFWGDIWEDVSGFFIDQWDLISGFWSDIFSDLYVWLDQALTDIWVYFVDVVIPAFMDALEWVIKSDPVQWVIQFVMKNLEALFDWIFAIDEEELRVWVEKSFDFIQEFVVGRAQAGAKGV